MPPWEGKGFIVSGSELMTKVILSRAETTPTGSGVTVGAEVGAGGGAVAGISTDGAAVGADPATGGVASLGGTGTSVGVVSAVPQAMSNADIDNITAENIQVPRGCLMCMNIAVMNAPIL